MIRDIKLEDIDVIFEHARQIAMRNGVLPPEFVLTKPKLIAGLFGPKKDWYGLVIEMNNKIIGSCLYCFTNTNRAFNKTSCLFLDLLFVEPKYQGQGIGKILINQLKDIARKSLATRIEFWCMKDNIRATKFYQNIGTRKVERLDIYNLPVSI